MATPSAEEFDADFGDARLTRRVASIVARMSADPAASLPSRLGDGAELDAAYRFFANRRVSRDKILAPHRSCSWERASAFLTVLSVEDTTEVRFGGKSERDGLGVLQHGGQGFRLHAALAVGFGGAEPVPLGIVAERVVVRSEERSVETQNQKKLRKDPRREHTRWFELAAMVDGAAKERGITVVHVADREADDFDYFGKIIERQGRFVVRLCKPRAVKKPQPPGFTPVKGHPQPLLDDVVPMATTFLERDVHLAPQAAGRTPRSKSRREARVATLRCQALSGVVLRRQAEAQHGEDITLNVVEVVEENPPERVSPVHWRLGTTEPVSTPEQIGAVVDMYRARWLIEEFWKALKTGTSLERRQLETLRSLENCMAVSIPLAWQMLHLRHLARHAPSTPATTAMPAGLLTALRGWLNNPALNNNRINLAPEPTIADALRAIARIGGHIVNNGDPGWLTLRRGLDRLLEFQRSAG
jgi:hypothetical protein